MGAQLVFDWDRLENFLITRDRPVGNKVTNTKCQSWVSHVQIDLQCTIALVSDAQKAKCKCMLRLNHDCHAIIERKRYFNTFAASAEKAYGQPSQETPQNVREQPIDAW